MKTIESLLTHSNPLIRKLVAGLLDLGHQDIKITQMKSSRYFSITDIKKVSELEIETDSYYNFSVISIKFMIFDLQEKSLCWHIQNMDNYDATWTVSVYAKTLEDIIRVLKVLKEPAPPSPIRYGSMAQNG